MLLFPDFDDNLRLAMRKETELFFGSIVHEDRSLIDLLNANYTFLNERLAKHYGIPNIYGSNFRRVELAPEFDMRRGLLGQASLQTTSSQPQRTSPVGRGKTILQVFRGVTEKLLNYALGRGDESTDMPLVRSIVHNAERNNYRFSSIVLGIVKSDAFEMNQKPIVSSTAQVGQGQALSR